MNEMEIEVKVSRGQLFKLFTTVVVANMAGYILLDECKKRYAEYRLRVLVEDLNSGVSDEHCECEACEARKADISTKETYED